jgi:hypothetical protein
MPLPKVCEYYPQNWHRDNLILLPFHYYFIRQGMGNRDSMELKDNAYLLLAEKNAK